MVKLMQSRASVGLHNNFVKGKELAMYERDVLVYFVASILSGGNLPACFRTTSTFMANK